MSIPATHTLGRVVLDSLQVDEAVAYDVDVMVVPDQAIPEDMCVGRTFLDIPYLARMRLDEEFFVGPRDAALQMIRRARTGRPRAVETMVIRPC